MTRRSFVWCLLAGCVLVCAACTVAPTELEADQVLTLHEKDNGRVIDIPVNTQIRVELSGSPTTGYWWHLQDLDQESLELMKEEIRDLAPPGIQGGRALGVWLFRAKKPGSTFLKLIYHRPWEKNIKPLKAFSVELKISEWRP